MASNGGGNNLTYVHNTFTAFNSRQYLSDARTPIVELESTKDIDNEHETKWQYAGNRDEFYSASSDTIQDEVYSSEEKALVRKIDLLIMPMICALDFLQVLQININYSRLYLFINMFTCTVS